MGKQRNISDDAELIRKHLLNGKHSIFRLDAHYSQTYLCAITK